MLDYRWKRLLSGFLALVLVAGMLPPAAVAAEEMYLRLSSEDGDLKDTDKAESESITDHYRPRRSVH